jgi:ATP-dependent exoDNAse (exonuclease V) alpha subunit
MNLERTPEFEEALQKMENGKAFVFITGRAGTGKSTLLRYFVEQGRIKAPVLAPTGVAALNVQGETIHRFFKIPPACDLETARMEAENRKKPEIYRQIQALIIDELSMLRADLLDAMDVFLQVIREDKRPFGGVRLIGIGDLFQLPPVVTTSDQNEFSQKYKTPYFFSSEAYGRLHNAGQIDFIELTKIYRQKDQEFIDLLNAIREREISETQLAHLNSRIINTPPPEDSIVLTPTNEAADSLNQSKMGKICMPIHVFDGEVEGKFQEKDMPTDLCLGLKVGARVMCVANDLNHKFVNGSLGWIKSFSEIEGERTVLVQLDDAKEPIAIAPYTWKIQRTKFNRRTGNLEQKSVGSFKQIPLRLAWAVTIHKSQGKSFDKVTLDLGRGAFAAGQIYVALSRCRTLEGLSLIKPITKWQLKPNDHVNYFFDNVLNQIPELEYLDEDGQMVIY